LPPDAQAKRRPASLVTASDRSPRLGVANTKRIGRRSNAHLISHYPKKEMVAEHSKPSTANVIPKESKSLRIGCDAILGCLNLREESIA
jgi:hypothetical protein